VQLQCLDWQAVHNGGEGDVEDEDTAALAHPSRQGHTAGADQHQRLTGREANHRAGSVGPELELLHIQQAATAERVRGARRK